MNVCCIDFDNVGILGITKALELHKEVDFDDFIIVGKHLEKVKMSTNILVEIANLTMQNKCKLHFHNKDIKNSSDFLLCYYIGVYNETYKQKLQSKCKDTSVLFHIISGDTSFISLEEIQDITVVIHNIHLPQEVLDKIAMEKKQTIETKNILPFNETQCRENKKIQENVKSFIIKEKSEFPISIKVLVRKLREHYGEKYHTMLEQDITFSRIKAMKMYIKDSTYLSYEKRSSLVSFI